MNITAKEYHITIAHNDLWLIAFDLKNTLLHTVKTHWVHHQNSWKKNEEQRLLLIRDMFYAMGNPRFYEDIFNEIDNIFLEFNKKLEH